MEIINISSYYEFLKYFNGFPRSDRCPYYYRGINASFQVIPSICYPDCLDKIHDFKSYEKCLISQFNREISTQYNITRYKENDWELWFLARHFGLKSRLIDFTKDDRIAIQFAMEVSSKGVARVYCLNHSAIKLIQEDDLRIGHHEPYSYNQLSLIHPSLLYEEIEMKRLGIDRMLIQMGNFLYQPLATIKTPLTDQIDQKYWKVFEIKNEHFAKIKHEILELDCRLMNKCLLKEVTPLDEACQSFNWVCIKEQV